MGDVAEPRHQGGMEQRNEPIMNQINRTIGRAARQKQKMINQSYGVQSKHFLSKITIFMENLDF